MSGMSVKTRLICTIVMFGLASLVSTNSTAQSVTCTYTSSEAANTGPGSGAYGINRFDATVGTWADTSFNAHGFYRSPQGKIVRFSIPKAVNTYPQGINDRGTIVGYFQNVSDNGSANGFKIGDGEVSHITYPGATYTEPHGINKKGDIVGWYALPNSPGAGFRLSGGQFSSFSYPGAPRSLPWLGGSTNPEKLSACGRIRASTNPGSSTTTASFRMSRIPVRPGPYSLE